MAMQTIAVGAAPNDGTGDPLRTLAQKANQNFSELYAALVFAAGGLAVLTNWLTATAYVKDQIVLNGTGLYRCLVSHGSGVFATDLAAGKWVLLATLPSGLPGADGKSLRTGTGAPSALLGVDGEYYIASDTFTLYGPKASGAWPAGIAMLAPTYGGTSTTSITIGTGSKAFTTQTTLAYTNGARIRASSNGDPTKWLEGVSTYALGVLTMTSDKTNGSGTFADWNFNIVGQPGAGDVSSANNLSDLASRYTARDNLSIHGADIASAATLNLEAATGDLVDVTGTVNVTAITLSEGHERTVRFTGAVLISNGASLVNLTGADITTAAGDFAVFRGYAAGVVRMKDYARASGKPLTANTPTEVGAAALAGNQNLTGGFTATSGGGTTVTGSNQTIPSTPGNGNIQDVTLNGSSLTGTLAVAVPSSPCTVVLEVTNGGSGAVGATLGAGSFTKSDLTAYNTTNGNKFHFFIVRSKNYSSLTVAALQ